MEIIFNWKNFEIEKPTVGSKVIFKRGDKLVVGVYNGDTSNDYPKRGCWLDDRKFPIYNFVGSEINPKSFSKKTVLSYPIYTPWSYSKEAFVEAKLDLPKEEFNPYNFEWDYYSDNWL